MLLINACGRCERSILQNNIRGRTMSSANFVCPTHFARASTLRKGLPTMLKFLSTVTGYTDSIQPVYALLWQCHLLATHSRRGEFHSLVDLNISGATTQVSRQRFLNLRTCW